jgi:hypothetical protein
MNALHVLTAKHFGLGTILLTFLLAAALCAVSSVRAADDEERCLLPRNIRPVVMVGGFSTGALLDSSNGFVIAYPDLEREPDDGLGIFGNITADVTLSLQWNASDLTQEASPLGPEASPDDLLPGLVGPVREVLTQVPLPILLSRRSASTPN